MHFVSNESIMVNFGGNSPLIFRKDGYIIDQKQIEHRKQIKVVAESSISSLFNKFFLVKDVETKYLSLLEYKDDQFQPQGSKFEIQ